MKRILVPTDFSATSVEALRHAVEYTYAVRGELLLLHVVEGEPRRRYAGGGRPEALEYGIGPMGNIMFFGYGSPQKFIHRDLCEEAQWKLSALLPPGFRDRARTLVTVGKVAHEIVRVAREQKADLIMMPRRGKRGLRHLFRSSVADKVIRKVPIPVITVDVAAAHMGLIPAFMSAAAKALQPSETPNVPECACKMWT